MKIDYTTSYRITCCFNDPQTQQAIRNTKKILSQIGICFRRKKPDLDIRMVYQKSLKPGSYSLSILASKRTVVIQSSDPEGSRCGLYEFLETLGIRWYSPSEKPLIPRLPLTICDLKRKEYPSFQGRALHICGTNHYDQRVVEWMSFLKMNQKLTHHDEVYMFRKQMASSGLKADTSVHSYNFWIQDQKYFQKHPEWFALVGGKRISQSQGGQLCLSNMRMRKEFVKNITDYLKKHSTVSVIGIPPNDGYGWCECEKCRNLDTDEDRKNGTVNGRVANFVADICTRLKTTNPEVLIGHYSYSNFADFFQELPEIPSNLIVSCTLFRCFKHAINDEDCPVNRPLWNRLKTIAKTVKHVSVYEYYTHRWGYLPAPIWKTISSDFKAYKNLGIEGFLSEVPKANSESYLSFHLPLYIAAKILYDVREDVEEILKDYCRRRFGKASTYMLKYFETLEKGLQNMSGCFKHRPEELEKMLPVRIRHSCASLLEASLARTKDETEAYNRVCSEKKLFDTWCQICEKRPLYKYHSPIKSLPIKLLSLSSQPKLENKLVFTDFITLIPPARNQTFVYVYSDDNNIGFLIDCFETQISDIHLEKGNKLNSVFNSDNIEIFLAAHQSTKTVYHILVNAGGYHCGAACEGKRWDWSWKGNYKIKTAILPDRWRLVFTISRNAIGASRDAFYFSLIRNRMIGGWEITGIPDGGAYFNASKYLKVV